jgi:hypothetical protein
MTRLRRENQKIEARISDCIVFFFDSFSHDRRSSRFAQGRPLPTSDEGRLDVSEWITGAVRRALRCVHDHPLDVAFVSATYRRISKAWRSGSTQMSSTQYLPF